MNYITVIIATYNRRNYLKKLLLQLQSQILPQEYCIQIIITVAGSTDGTIEMIEKEFPSSKIIQGSTDWWWTQSVNEGLKLALKLRSDFFLLLNDDNEIEKDYLRTLISNYSQIPNGSILGSASISLDETDKIDSAGSKGYSRFLNKYEPYYFKGAKIDKNFFGVHKTWSLTGRGTLIPQNTLNKVGLLDNNLIQYDSDDDFILRAKKMKIPVYISWDALVYNHTKMTCKSRLNFSSFKFYIFTFFDKHSVNSLSKYNYIYKKHGYKYLAPLYVLYMFGSELLIYLFLNSSIWKKYVERSKNSLLPFSLK